MRKISLLLVAAFAGMTSFAQYNVLKETKAEQGLTTSDDAQRVEMAKQTKTSRAAGDVIASFDFNDGNWPAGWTTDYTASNPGPWLIVDTTRKAAYCSKEEQLIYSTDENNKFLLLPAAFHNTVPGSNPPQMVASPVNLDAAFISDWIDITAANGAVQFAMNTAFRYYGGGKLELSVQTKNADGTESEWTAFDLTNVNGVDFQSEMSPSTPNPADPAKPFNYIRQEVNITPVTYQQSQMKFKVRFFNTSHYFWAIDDIAIEEVTSNDMKISAIYAPSSKIYTETDTYSDGVSGIHKSYNYYATEMPASFVNAVNPGLLAHQKGTDGTNVKAEFKVDSVGTEIFTANSQYTVANFGTTQKVDKVLFTDTTGWYTNTPPARPIFFSPALTQDFFETNDFLADGIPYTFKYKISSDNEDTDMANNEASRQSFSQTLGRISYHTSSTVDDTVNSKPIGRNSFHGWTSSTPKTDGLDTKGIEMWLDPGKTAAGEDVTFKFYGVRVFIPKNPSNPASTRKTTFDGAGNGVTIRAVIWKRTSEGWAKLDLSKDEGKTIKAEDLGKWCYLDLDADKVAAEDLTAGRYIMGVEMQAYNGQKLMVGSDATPGQQDAYNKVYFKFSGTAKWSWAGVSGAIMIDAYTSDYQFNKDQTDVKELPSTVADEVVVFPNPTQGILKVRNAENATINVYSITGSKLLSVENQDLERTINLSNFQKGTYLIQVVKNNKVVTKKVTLL